MRIPVVGLSALLVAACTVPGGRDDMRGSSLDWLPGCWQSNDGSARETWVSEADGSMIGFSVVLAHGRLVAHELLSIRDSGGGRRIYTAHPSGQARTAFVESEAGADFIRFANAGHDYPQIIAYRREGERLYAEIARMDGSDARRFSWRRCD